ncbi:MULTISPECIES: hypothetical protein [unclassified Flavobacterium]|uniref:hypothetical protein n=1 Tax=unclassified Flavobacterium TaxID=196869 RepID=UPI00086944C1|nr:MULTISPECIES: hypothetical protein [unclassified Flavobacterium]MBN9285546.1 hypothetical protein [Flavobacterium sp.]ODS81473.1 MAG: hypothetical protein ABS44_19240 [Chryseobacterium sp. SCN 40-13]OJV71095.1 MAG: hypothetical protein BGO42_04580 [Flavobacterium sp. 40-81]
MEEEYTILYNTIENRKINFFKVRDSDLILIPGSYLYTTTLTEQDINDLDQYKKISLIKLNQVPRPRIKNRAGTSFLLSAKEKKQKKTVAYYDE